MKKMDGKEKIRLIETMDYFPAKGKKKIHSLLKAKKLLLLSQFLIITVHISYTLVDVKI